jgi:hypothetical protein
VKAGVLHALGLVLTSCSGGYTIRGYPEWTLSNGVQSVGCAQVEAWVGKSGKQGVGISLALRKATNVPCSVQVAGASIVVGGERVTTKLGRRVLALTAEDQYLYLPFVFDNEAAWNENRRAGSFELALETRGVQGRLTMEMRHAWTQFHRRRRDIMPASAAGEPEPAGTAYQLESEDSGVSAP